MSQQPPPGAEQQRMTNAQVQERLSDLEAKVAAAQRDLFRQQSTVDSARAELDAFKTAHRATLEPEPPPAAAPPPRDPGPTIIPERDRQNRNETNSFLKTLLLILLGVLGALLLLALLWVLGIFPRTTAATAPMEPILQDTNAGVLGGADITADTAPAGNALEPAVDGRFQPIYDRYGMNVLGRPLSGMVNENGLDVQWFERARLEFHPNLAGTPYEIQFSRLGAIYTDGRDFAEQEFFASRPDLRFFDVTRHAVGGSFLSFWEQNGGMETFGYPISEEFDEVLPDGTTYRVQYFERARLELHPNLAGTEHNVQVGLLGTALYNNDPRRPMTMQPVPTPVPLP